MCILLTTFSFAFFPTEFTELFLKSLSALSFRLEIHTCTSIYRKQRYFFIISNKISKISLFCISTKTLWTYNKNLFFWYFISFLWLVWCSQKSIFSLNPFVINASFLYPLKTSEKLTVFWCFQGLEKGCIGNEWAITNTRKKHVKYEQNHFFTITPYKIFPTVKKIQTVTRDPSPNPIKRWFCFTSCLFVKDKLSSILPRQLHFVIENITARQLFGLSQVFTLGLLVSLGHQ